MRLNQLHSSPDGREGTLEALFSLRCVHARTHPGLGCHNLHNSISDESSGPGDYISPVHKFDNKQQDFKVGGNGPHRSSRDELAASIIDQLPN